MISHITIELTDIRCERGAHYRVHRAGTVLVEEYDAAPALLALGIAGKVEVRRGDKVTSTMDVARAANLTIVENANVGPAIGQRKAFADDYIPPPAAVSGRAGVLSLPAKTASGERAAEKRKRAASRFRDSPAPASPELGLSTRAAVAAPAASCGSCGPLNSRPLQQGHSEFGSRQPLLARCLIGGGMVELSRVLHCIELHNGDAIGFG
jgi:hypothetical protein